MDSGVTSPLPNPEDATALLPHEAPHHSVSVGTVAAVTPIEYLRATILMVLLGAIFGLCAVAQIRHFLFTECRRAKVVACSPHTRRRTRNVIDASSRNGCSLAGYPTLTRSPSFHTVVAPSSEANAVAQRFKGGFHEIIDHRRHRRLRFSRNRRV